VFTDGEKDELAVLLRQYYLIAPTIRAEDDLDIVTTDLTANQALLAQVDTLTNQCNAQKTNIGYAGPQTVKDNPYYTSPTGAGTTPYLPSFSQLEEIFNIW
jgi:hypothetical protein